MEKARQMIGYRLITKQTTSQGQLCEYVMVAKSLNIRREYYFSITLDRLTNVSILLHNQYLFNF
jgi:succinyl-CoA synthetase beta subunit